MILIFRYSVSVLDIDIMGFITAYHFFILFIAKSTTMTFSPENLRRTSPCPALLHDGFISICFVFDS
ncbi:unnamed protein product [Amoebophrya sp. A25]|nr:unnamed protein product [Amoebophrya sp. A25]|eukprot:GSA25T00004070001.1